LSNCFLKESNESIKDYKIRLCQNKDEYSLSWQEVAELINGVTSENWGESKYRKWWYAFQDGLEYSSAKQNKVIENSNDESQPYIPQKEKLEINKDGSHTSEKLLEMSNEQSKDVDYLLSAHGYDIREWELTSARNNIWNVYSKIDGVQTLYSSKIVVRPRKENDISVDEIKEFFTELSRDYQSAVHTPVRYSKDGKMLELNIADLHLGKLCWNGDSGDCYDEKIAEERFFYIINDVIERTKDHQLEKILFVFSNDFFHFDTLTKTTTGGTPQDTNLQYKQMYKLGCTMLVKALDLLKDIAPVETFYIGSNHDKLTSYFAVENLSAWFRNDSNISVDTDPKTRKYVEFGNSLIQFSHGHSEKKRLGTTMQVEAREAWGRTLYHEVHAAHIHSEKTVTEDNGVIIRHVSSPTGTDAWHYNSGYVGAVKKAQSFLWDRENGLELIINTPVK
jgi:hypothetical protein